MATKSWVVKMRNKVKKSCPHPKSVNKQQTIGILSFEVANVMSKVVHLHKSLSNHEIYKLQNDIITLEGVKKLVSLDESYLMYLAYLEKIDDLDRIAKVVSRLGKKCNEQVLIGFEHVYGDVISGKIKVNELGFLFKDVDCMIRKFERYIGKNGNLYCELQVLNELEDGFKKFGLVQIDFDRRMTWHRQNVKHLKDDSLWNMSFDKVVEMLVRMVFTIYRKICVVFENFNSGFNGGLMKVECGNKDGNVENFNSVRLMNRSQSLSVEKNGVETVYPNRSFTKCVSLRDVCECPKNTFGPKNAFWTKNCIGSKNKLARHATSSTVGGSALEVHYANLIIVLEKFLRYPHLVDTESRDDLYQMLPLSLKNLLQTNLESHSSKNDVICDGGLGLARDWKEILDGALRWLVPLAQNTLRWQNERNVEKQYEVTRRSSVFLLETLYFADREKLEGVLLELLVGLNYICRYEQQRGALLDCVGSFEFGDWMTWQLQCQITGLK